jgi:hypothetical protein
VLPNLRFLTRMFLGQIGILDGTNNKTGCPNLLHMRIMRQKIKGVHVERILLKKARMQYVQIIRHLNLHSAHLQDA